MAWLLAPMFFAGCGIFGHGRDPVCAVKIHQLADYTQDVLEKAETGRLSASASRAYLDQGIAVLTELRTREAARRADAEELRRLSDLQARFEKVRARGTPVRVSDGPALQSGICAIQERNGLPSPRRPGSSEETSSSSSDDTATTTTEDECKDKKKDQDKDKRDRKRDRDDCEDGRRHRMGR